MDDLTKTSIFFDRFEVDLARRRLLRDGEQVPLKSKSFDLLAAFAQNSGELLTKDKLFDLVWDGQIVEENNLSVHVAALRKALGEKRGDHRFIVTVPGKGYRFIGETTPGLDTELIVESHTVQRITIEEHEHVTDEPNEKETAQAALPSPRPAKGLRWLMAGFGVSAILVAAFFFWPAISGMQAGALNPLEGGRFTRLTNNGRVSLAALSPDGNRFAYVTRDRSQEALWVGDVSGGDQLLLRPESDTDHIDLAFSSDGSSIIFSAKGGPEAEPVVYRMPALGGPVEKLLTGAGHFTLSPDGSWVAFATTAKDPKKTLLVKAPLSGGDRVTIAELDGEVLRESVSWSSDGSRVAVAVGTGFESFSEIAFFSAEGGELNRLSKPEWQVIDQITWTEGDRGLFVTALDRTSWAAVPQLHLYHIDLKDGSATPVTNDLSTYGSVIDYSSSSNRLLTVERRQMNNVWVAPAGDLSAARAITNSSFGRYDGLWGLGWTPDEKLIYTTSDTRSTTIAQMNSDGTGQKLLTTPGSVDSALAVSPDGTFVTFHSRRSGRFNIWRMNIDGSDQRQLTFTDDAFQPFVSPDSAWIYYKHRSEGIGGMARIPANGGTPEILTNDGASWGRFSPDGKYIAAAFFQPDRTLFLYSADNHRLLRKFTVPPTATSFVGLGWMPDSRSIIYRDTEFGYWVQPIDGGEPQRLGSMPDELLYNFSWSNDGKFFAFVRGQDFRDVVLLSAAKE